jgi:glutamate dehydrogenase (NAD(P)+)
LDIPALLEFANKNKGIQGFSGGDSITNVTLLASHVDVLIPAALGGVLTKDNAEDVKASIIVEAANGPTTPGADWELVRRGDVRIVPDILANAGGVTCSYFEQVQGNTNHYWSQDEVLEKLDARMTAAYREVSDTSVREHANLRDAAYLIAVDRVAQACHKRGWV